jgi:tRNA A-37 threonylcarbamoyl transferase component Bud32
MNFLFCLPHVIFCRAHLRVKRWKNWSLVSSNKEMGSNLESHLDMLLSGVGENHRLLKKSKGHRVTMAVNSDGKRVIKLYTPKKGLSGFFHSFLPSKAFMEYCMTQRLFSLGIPVPQPLAAVERRWFPGNGKSILITEYMEGYERVSRVFSLMEGDERGPFLEDLACFTKRLHSTCFCHADLWARNILVKENKRDFFIIDLDGGYFNCILLPIRAPVNLAQLLFSLNRASALSMEEVERFLGDYGAARKTIKRTIKAYQRKFGPWPWRGDTP